MEARAWRERGGGRSEIERGREEEEEFNLEELALEELALEELALSEVLLSEVLLPSERTTSMDPSVTLQTTPETTSSFLPPPASDPFPLMSTSSPTDSRVAILLGEGEEEEEEARTRTATVLP